VQQLLAQKNWGLLELRRELPPLEDVFRELTIGEDRRDRLTTE